MTATTDLTPDEQYQLVYNGITAVASRCDGAVTEDGVGFNGQDTHFGRRIASVPFSEWTPDVKIEAARIANRYQTQIEAYTGIAVTELPVVQAAKELKTLTSARNDARGYENVGKKAERKATRLNDGRLALRWNSKDPDCFGALLTAVKALPGRRWTGSENVVDFSAEALAFIEEFGLKAVNFDVAELAPDAQAASEEAQAAKDAFWAEQNRIAEEKRSANNRITLEGSRVRIRFDYDPAKVAAVRDLPGRQYDGSSKSNTADLHPAVLTFAKDHGLAVDPAVVEALGNVEATVSAAQAEATLRKGVSNLANPAELPADFVQRVLDACPKAVLV
jgi:hypothetical protein